MRTKPHCTEIGTDKHSTLFVYICTNPLYPDRQHFWKIPSSSALEFHKQTSTLESFRWSHVDITESNCKVVTRVVRRLGVVVIWSKQRGPLKALQAISNELLLLSDSLECGSRQMSRSSRTPRKLALPHESPTMNRSIQKAIYPSSTDLSLHPVHVMRE